MFALQGGTPSVRTRTVALMHARQEAPTRASPAGPGLYSTRQDAARRLAVVLMRDPWDADWLRPGVVGVTAFGWRRCQLEAALACLAPITER